MCMCVCVSYHQGGEEEEDDDDDRGEVMVSFLDGGGNRKVM